ncbi:hypothetical protein [Helicobacter turcicus]|uniref:Uncharacterized protein n=1 Tax=Helicobacter turcicus TaxID=2867412 RepID=A0ABS7JM64_9HELI|nr:hypothetical protein [Helicobacter turcicus]MBX7490481.1 hypothetical protein [Helicobacter turcicus]MBX7545341.1 hypothetical protein [Helicobacter turcicus]
MTIINQETRDILVENVKVTPENLILGIEHSLISNDIEAQRVFFLKVPESCKKALFSKDWYWDGSKLKPYTD